MEKFASANIYNSYLFMTVSNFSRVGRTSAQHQTDWNVQCVATVKLKVWTPVSPSPLPF